MILIASGQCGNQLSAELLQSLYSYTPSTPAPTPSSSSSSSSRHHTDPHPLESVKDNDASDAVREEFFSRPSSRGSQYIAKIVSLDTEPKVIQACCARQRGKPWRYDEDSMLYRHGGAGNNWALGYQMFSTDLKERAVEAIRRQLERSTLMTESFLSLHSIGGGTGSGLGTRCTETLAEEFPDVFSVNVVVAPYHFGEVVVQHFNTLLALTHLNTFSNAILMMENQTALDICRNTLSIERPLLADINKVLSRNLLPFLLPKHSTSSSSSPSPSSSSSSSSLYTDLRHLCSHPHFKFCQLYTSPLTPEASVDYTHDNWTTLLRAIAKYSFDTHILYSSL